MKFELGVAKSMYHVTDIDDLRKIKKLGFEFYPSKNTHFTQIDGTKQPTIEITTMDDLLKFIQDCNSDIIISIDNPDIPTIIIYNGYVE